MLVSTGETHRLAPATMLTNSSRQRFEQIRAQWETAPLTHNSTASMTSRKGRQAAQHSAGASTDGHTGSKIRRKLSYGLSFISNPLGQRKITPNRQPLLQASPTKVEPDVGNNGAELDNSDRSFSSTQASLTTDDSQTSLLQCRTPNNNLRLADITDPDGTPKALPRSHTMNFIPVSSRRNSASSTLDPVPDTKPRPTSVTLDSKVPATISKIPTPSPPVTGHRRASPRQYIPRYTPKQAKHIAAGMAFAGITNESPSHASMRSMTTPNLVKGTSLPQPTRFMAPRRSILREPTLQENIPVSKRRTKRLSPTEETEYENILASSRTSIKQCPPQLSFNRDNDHSSTTLRTPGKPLGSDDSPAFAVKTLWQRQQDGMQARQSSHDANKVSILQPRLMGPVEPPTPSVDLGSIRPELPRASTERNLRRRSILPPLSVDSTRKYSRALDGGSSKVSLPRSSSFHNLKKCNETIPPVPPIPERFKNLSMPNFTQSETMARKTASQHMSLENTQGSDSSSSLNGKPMKELDSPDVYSPSFEQDHNHSSQSGRSEPFEDKRSLISSKLAQPRRGHFVSLPRLTSKNKYGLGANIVTGEQVKKRMPTSYWAGRFQSRLDHWHTEAMHAESSPSYCPEGELGQYSLSQRREAACCIFAQLQALCTSKDAAESLWEFEYMYRKEHKLIDPSFDTPPVSYRKQRNNSASTQGSFGWAVRKLTPRKSSLVNLLKGKGWNKGDEVKPDDPAGYTQLSVGDS